MLFDIREAQTFVVSCKSPEKKSKKRRGVIENLLSKHGFDIEIQNGLYCPSNPVYGCSVSHAFTAECANYESPPLLILEDDVDLMSEDFKIDIPDEADAIYLGLSTAGLSFNSPEYKHAWGHVYYQPYDKELSQIYNMLSTHAILITSQRFARHYALCALESAIRNQPIDCLLARCQKHFYIFARNTPLFYQKEDLGGQEKYTKINKIEGIKVKTMSDLPEVKKGLNPPCLTEEMIYHACYSM